VATGAQDVPVPAGSGTKVVDWASASRCSASTPPSSLCRFSSADRLAGRGGRVLQRNRFNGAARSSRPFVPMSPAGTGTVLGSRSTRSPNTTTGDHEPLVSCARVKDPNSRSSFALTNSTRKPLRPRQHEIEAEPPADGVPVITQAHSPRTRASSASSRRSVWGGRPPARGIRWVNTGREGGPCRLPLSLTTVVGAAPRETSSPTAAWTGCRSRRLRESSHTAERIAERQRRGGELHRPARGYLPPPAEPEDRATPPRNPPYHTTRRAETGRPTPGEQSTRSWPQRCLRSPPRTRYPPRNPRSCRGASDRPESTQPAMRKATIIMRP